MALRDLTVPPLTLGVRRASSRLDWSFQREIIRRYAILTHAGANQARETQCRREIPSAAGPPA